MTLYVIRTTNESVPCKKCNGDTNGKTIVATADTEGKVIVPSDEVKYCKPCTVKVLRSM